MGADTKIAWTDHTFNPWSPIAPRVLFAVAFRAKGDAVVEDEAQLGVSRKALDVVRAEVATSCVAAVTACEPVAQKHVEPPPLVFHAESLSASLGEPTVFVGVTPFAARSVCASGFADFSSCLLGVPNPEPIARPTSSGFAHLPSRLRGHRRALRNHQEIF